MERVVEKQFFVYIMANKHNTTVYVGVTSDLVKRAYEHKSKQVKGFTQRYNVDKLVYYEPCSDSLSAIAREKQLKAGSRKRKNDLINSMNPEWRELYDDIV